MRITFRSKNDYDVPWGWVTSCEQDETQRWLCRWCVLSCLGVPREACFGQSRDRHTQEQIQREIQLPVVFHFYGSGVSFWIMALNEKAALLWWNKYFGLCYQLV